MPNTPKPKRSKIEKVTDAVDKATIAAEAVKEFTPPEVDAMIDRGTQSARLGLGLFAMIREMFKKKK